ncbi:MAG TPA: sn-glycerol-3-phosphate ABC transporter ATP-binding protein UgpC [Thermoanaerobaculia bacterium]|nr:sn-glycerol-3-phosphate ABC transporter ATP-binding protein UgpC [Thermoanaerobaculia bacterium]
MAGVRFDGVSKQYGAVSVIEGLDLDIRDKEFMVLVGPSGCGKSTALRMIAGLEEISSGRIRIGERVVNELAPKERDIAMVFQSYALYPHMTVRENLAFGLRIRKTSKEEMERRVREAAEILDIAHLLDRKPRQLSGGQRQRVAVGRAIVRKPSVFLFDEPLSNLDAKLRVQMRSEITRLQQRLETTCVYVTHDQVEAMTMGHRIAVMNAGRLQQVGTPLEVYERPVNLFVANFIGTPPMNFFRGRIADGGAELRAGTFTVRLAEAGGRARPDGEVVAGIRPEHVVASPGEPRGPAARVEGTVELVEPLGHEVVVHVRAGEDMLVTSVDPAQAPRLDDAIELRIELERLHLFDAASEQRLEWRGGDARA